MVGDASRSPSPAPTDVPVPEPRFSLRGARQRGHRGADSLPFPARSSTTASLAGGRISILTSWPCRSSTPGARRPESDDAVERVHGSFNQGSTEDREAATWESTTWRIGLHEYDGCPGRVFNGRPRRRPLVSPLPPTNNSVLLISASGQENIPPPDAIEVDNARFSRIVLSGCLKNVGLFIAHILTNRQYSSCQRNILLLRGKSPNETWNSRLSCWIVGHRSTIRMDRAHGQHSRHLTSYGGS